MLSQLHGDHANHYCQAASHPPFTLLYNTQDHTGALLGHPSLGHLLALLRHQGTTITVRLFIKN
jgi:hypothetical protein